MEHQTNESLRRKTFRYECSNLWNSHGDYARIVVIRVVLTEGSFAGGRSKLAMGVTQAHPLRVLRSLCRTQLSQT